MFVWLMQPNLDVDSGEHIIIITLFLDVKNALQYVYSGRN